MSKRSKSQWSAAGKMSLHMPVALFQACAPCSRTFILCSLCQLFLFSDEETVSEQLGGLSGVAVQGLQKVGHNWATNTWYDVTWGEGVLHPKLPAPQDLLSWVSPSCRGDARQKSRNEWSRERGSFKCLLLASFTWGSGYQQGSHAQHPKWMSVIQKKPHEQKTSMA